MFNTKGTVLKYHKRSDTYRNSNSNCVVDLNSGIATSYKWWQFSFPHPTKRNTIILNTGYYSVTTSNHQSATLDLFKEKGFKVIEVNIGTAQLLESTFYIDGGNLCINRIIESLVAINRKGSKKSANEDRMESIRHNINELKELAALGVIVDLDKIEMTLAQELAEDFNRLHFPDYKYTMNKENTKAKMTLAKRTLDNFDEIHLVAENVNDLNEVSL